MGEKVAERLRLQLATFRLSVYRNRCIRPTVGPENDAFDARHSHQSVGGQFLHGFNRGGLGDQCHRLRRSATLRGGRFIGVIGDFRMFPSCFRMLFGEDYGGDAYALRRWLRALRTPSIAGESGFSSNGNETSADPWTSSPATRLGPFRSRTSCVKAKHEGWISTRRRLLINQSGVSA